MTQLRLLFLLLLTLLFCGCSTLAALSFQQKYGSAAPKQREITVVADNSIDYWADVSPVLEKRCISCHACYDAPCQLKLTSPEGIDRGASKQKVYDAARLGPGQLTRLYEDAHTTEAWRHKGFFPVLNEYAETDEANRQASVMYQMLALKQQHPLPTDEVLLPESITLGLDRSETCTTAETFDSYAQSNPLWGMPYGLPAIPDAEQQVLQDWIEQGGRYTQPPALDGQTQSLINNWEAWLNRDSLKARLVSRYLYEHLFLAHLYFSDQAQPTYFKLVRSATPPGQPIELIATRRPYDDPGVERVYYRLRQEREAIVNKTHMPYALNDARLQRWQQLFFETTYEVDHLPGYSLEVAANPFNSFEQLPPGSRYRFMLDEAKFTVQGFIKGPVCRGQVALNVIRDHFWVFFVDPDLDKHIDTVGFLRQHKQQLEMPNVKGNIYLPLSNWRAYANKQKAFLQARDSYLSELAQQGGQVDLNLIWDGNGSNPNAALTIFRHFDSASVHQGLLGEPPQTAWIIGYELLERIHYLLVAGYDVYGNVGHQLLSRIYMDFLRMEGEAGFLQLLPTEVRNAERNNWYREAEPEIFDYLTMPNFEKQDALALTYHTDDPKQELYQRLQQRVAPALQQPQQRATISADSVNAPLMAIQAWKGLNTQYLPEVLYLGIQQGPQLSLVSIVQNRAHLNMTAMFNEHKVTVPEENTLSVVPGLVGSYIYAYLIVDQAQLENFVAQLTAIQSEQDYGALMDRYGIRRTSPLFWQHFDQLQRAVQASAPIEAGIYDLNRLENR